jgi:hypothetical protein
LLLVRSGSTLRTKDHTRSYPMNTTKLVALLAALLLTAAEYLVLDYDAQQRVTQYQSAAANELATRE